MGSADLHIHTIYSLDGTATVRAVLKRAVDAGLDVIAITDHDEIRGSLEAAELAPAYGIQAIPASEISTADGHLLALFIRSKIQKGLSLEETLWRVGEQGGVCIAPHPGGEKRISLPADLIRRTIKVKELAEILVGVEAINASRLFLQRNSAGMELAARIPLAQVGNSDAHMVWMIGKGVSSFEGRTALELRRALIDRTTKACLVATESRFLMLSRWFSCLFLRYTAGRVFTNNSPHAPIQLARVTG